MSKILALDVGDQWVGTALSDKLHMLSKPYITITQEELVKNLSEIFVKESIDKIVIGYPITMKGTQSEQTKKIIIEKEKLEKIFPDKLFILWDERLSSKRAQTVNQAKTKEEKLKSHSLAAAFILESYLNYLHSKSN